MKIALPAALAGVVLVLRAVVPEPAFAHGFERPFALPVPLWLYLAGAAVAVAASFVIAAVTVGGARPAPRYPLLSVPRLPSVTVAGVLGVVGMVWWIGMIVLGLSGLLHMFAPAVLFWVLLWVGVPIFSAVIGNPWPALSPFRTTFALVEAASGLLGASQVQPSASYPRALARWPAVIFLLAAFGLEFVIPGAYDGRQIGIALVAYTVLTLFGMLLFGRSAWLRNAELFEILFGWFGRIGLIGRRTVDTELCDGCLDACRPERCIDCPDCTATRGRGDQVAVIRPWFAGLTEVRRTGWSDAAFILLALAGVSYDGLRETAAWGQVMALLFEPIQSLAGPLNTIIAIDAIGLVGVWLLFIVLFGAAAAVTRRLAGAADPLPAVAGAYAATFLPIAAGYLIAHYFTLLVQGAIWLPDVLTDPRSSQPDVGFIPSAAIWYVSVAAIVLGHIAAVVLAHRLALIQRPRHAGRVGLPLVVVMIGYTVLSLWIIAQPLTTDPI